MHIILFVRPVSATCIYDRVVIPILRCQGKELNSHAIQMLENLSTFYSVSGERGQYACVRPAFACYMQLLCDYSPNPYSNCSPRCETRKPPTATALQCNTVLVTDYAGPHQKSRISVIFCLMLPRCLGSALLVTLSLPVLTSPSISTSNHKLWPANKRRNYKSRDMTLTKIHHRVTDFLVYRQSTWH